MKIYSRKKRANYTSLLMWQSRNGDRLCEGYGANADVAQHFRAANRTARRAEEPAKKPLTAETAEKKTLRILGVLCVR